MRSRYFIYENRNAEFREKYPEVRGENDRRPDTMDKTIILLVSQDGGLGESLRFAANQTGRIVVRVEGAAAALLFARSMRPAAVLLDVDSCGEAVWEAADALLHLDDCPPMIVLTAHSDPFELGSGRPTGAILDKSASTMWLLEMVDQALAAPGSATETPNAASEVPVHWFQTRSWSVAVEPSYRCWGINE
jgi:DNA-binding response OmpR family regulator